MATSNNFGNTQARQPWEELDNDLEANTVASTPEQEHAIDDSLGLQMISIRLQRTLLANLKAIAQYHGVGYQPLIRDLLNRFAKSETQNILLQIEQQQVELLKMEADNKVTPQMETIDNFLARESERKRA